MSFNPKVVKFPNKVTGKLRIGNTAADYGLYGTGTVQKFELGTRYAIDDRAFRYGNAKTDVNPRVGAFDYGAWFTDTLDAAAVVGQEYIVIKTGSTSGDTDTGFGTTNKMVGGIFSYPSSTSKQVRRIEGHIAAPDGTTVKVYLDGPITLAMDSGVTVEFQANPYSNLRNAGGTNRAVMGVPVTLIVSDSFGWFQTWGPTWMVQNEGLDFSGGYETLAAFTEGGNLTNADNNSGTGQLAGFIMGTRTQGGTFVNPPFVFLKINP